MFFLDARLKSSYTFFITLTYVMTITHTPSSNATVQLTITVPVSEHQPFLEKAAETVGKYLKIDGFRPGHIPFDVVQKEIGEMKLLETASEEMIKKALVQAVKENSWQTVGSPEIKIKTLAPGNDVVVEATWALLPTVTVPSLDGIVIEQKPVEITETEINGSLEELRKMRAAETPTEDAAISNSRVVVDMVICLEKVPVEGGTAKDHSLVLDEQSYVPGLTDKLVGAKKGDHLDFTLKFPETYYQKMLAGKEAEFSIDVKEVFARVLPALDDEFAKALRFDTLDALKDVLKANIKLDHEREENSRVRAEVIEAVMNKAEISEIPAILIESEKERLFAELRAQIEGQGLSFDQYLADVKQSPEQIAEGMTDSANKRVKISLTLRAIARDNAIALTEDEMEAEIASVRTAYSDNPHIEERLHDENILDFIRMNATHRKTTDFLVEKLVK